MKLILFLFILASCASAPTYVRKFREYKVTDRHEAEEIFQKKINFLRLTYEQINLPDLNVKKFSPDCLKSIFIDPIHVFDGGLKSVSRVYFSSDYGTGLCLETPNSRTGNFVLIFCEKKKTVYQVSCFSEDCARIDWEEQC